MQGQRAVLKLAGAATACLLLLTACSGGEQNAPSDLPNKPDKTKDAPQTPEGTPTPEPPTPSPVSSDKHDSWTVVRQYVASKGYAFRTGDTEPLKELSAPGCESCQGTIDLIEEVHAAGGHFEGDYEGKIDDISGSEDVVVLYIKYGEAREVSEKGASPEVYAPENQSDTFSLKREGSQWVVAKIDSQDAK